jgi:hypothetical protein
MNCSGWKQQYNLCDRSMPLYQRMEDRPRHDVSIEPHHPQDVIAVEETAAQREMNRLHARRRKGMEIRTGPPHQNIPRQQAHDAGRSSFSSVTTVCKPSFCLTKWKPSSVPAPSLTRATRNDRQNTGKKQLDSGPLNLSSARRDHTTNEMRAFRELACGEDSPRRVRGALVSPTRPLPLEERLPWKTPVALSARKLAQKRKQYCRLKVLLKM